MSRLAPLHEWGTRRLKALVELLRAARAFVAG
jgi:hypothetical protein